MAARAESDPRYYRRFLIMGIAALGFALWSLYDGIVKYPNQRERGLAFEKLEKEGRVNDWNAYARERGWPTNYPGEPKSEGDIMMQYVMAALAGTLGGWLLLGVWRARGRWIESTDSGVNSSWGQNFDFDQVMSLNKRKWKDKGIAKVTYQDGGRERRFVLDNYKFARDTTDQILYDLESVVGHDKITGGPPETLLEVHGEDVVDIASERLRNSE